MVIWKLVPDESNVTAFCILSPILLICPLASEVHQSALLDGDWFPSVIFALQSLILGEQRLQVSESELNGESGGISSCAAGDSLRG